ncbi:MAG: hypothetical protein ACYC55_06695 [Candidatus Geothermincolia bacterium]
MRKKRLKASKQKKLDVISIYKGIRKPTAPPTRIEDRRSSRAVEKAQWQKEEDE